MPKLLRRTRCIKAASSWGGGEKGTAQEKARANVLEDSGGLWTRRAAEPGELMPHGSMGQRLLYGALLRAQELGVIGAPSSRCARNENLNEWLSEATGPRRASLRCVGGRLRTAAGRLVYVKATYCWRCASERGDTKDLSHQGIVPSFISLDHGLCRETTPGIPIWKDQTIGQAPVRSWRLD